MATLPVPQLDPNDPRLKLLAGGAPQLPAPAPLLLTGRGLSALSGPLQPPNLPAPPPLPSVLNPNSAMGRLGPDDARLSYLRSSGSGIDQITNPVDQYGNPTGQPVGFGRKLLGGLAKVGDIGLSLVAPAAAMAVPGTTLHHELLLKQQQNRIGQDLGEAQQQAQNQALSLQNAEAPQKAADASALSQAQTGLLGAQTKRALIPIAPTVKYSVAGLPESVNDGYGHVYLPTDQNMPPQIKQMFAVAMQNYQTNANKTLKPLSQDDANARNSIWNPILQQHHLPLNQFTPGMSSTDAAQVAGSLNNVIGRGQGDSHIAISLQGLNLQRDRFNAGNTLDTTDPATAAAVASVARGDTKLTDIFGRGATLAQKAAFVTAVKQVNPNFNSGDHDIENAVRSYMTSGQGGSTLTALSTLTHHLDLYDKAVDAVHNGNVHALNVIGNEMGIQMGNNAQTNLALIRQGVAMEAARVYTGGVPGEAEINQFNASLSGDGSPQQMHGGAATVRTMALGKLQGLQGQAAAGAQGRPNFNGGSGASQPIVQHSPSTGQYRYSMDGGRTWQLGKPPSQR